MAALDVLGRILVDDTPHPIGTETQARVRERLMRELQQAGAEPEESHQFICSPVGSCGWVNNVVVHLEGSRDSALLYSCHTDSVGAGPGAGDDGAAVAIGVELVRHWVKTPHENSLIFLFDEGEEVGLLGALAFLERDPLAANVAAAVNLEARGTAGISQLFETSADSSWMVSAWVASASYPFANSLSDLVYDTLPHLTDLTVWEWFGIPAVNFALTEESQHYHTAMDTVANLDVSAVQSHGDNAWTLFEVLANADLDHAPLGEKAYFDVLGLAVIRWPVAWTPWLAVAGLFLALGMGWRNREDLSWRASLAAGTAWIGAVLASAGWAAGLVFALQSLTGVRNPWEAHGLPLTVGIALGVFTIIGLTGTLTKTVRKCQVTVLTVLTAAIAVVLGVFLPAVAYLFAIPSAVASVSGAVPGLAAAVVLWFPIVYGLAVALGLDAAIVLGGVLALALTFAIPPCADLPARRIAVGLPLAALCAMVTLWLPQYSETVPERVSGQVLTSGEAPPVLEDLALRIHGGVWQLTGTLRSARGATSMLLSVPAAAGVNSLRLEGTPVDDPQGDIAIYAVPEEGIRFEADLADPSVPWTIYDSTRGSDPAPRPRTTVSQDGFQTVVRVETAPLPMAGMRP